MNDKAEKKSFWSKYAGIYDGFMKKDTGSYRRMYELIRPVVADKNVLELACGTGLISKNIVSAAESVEIVRLLAGNDRDGEKGLPLREAPLLGAGHDGAAIHVWQL